MCIHIKIYIYIYRFIKEVNLHGKTLSTFLKSFDKKQLYLLKYVTFWQSAVFIKIASTSRSTTRIIQYFRLKDTPSSFLLTIKLVSVPYSLKNTANAFNQKPIKYFFSFFFFSVFNFFKVAWTKTDLCKKYL